MIKRKVMSIFIQRLQSNVPLYRHENVVRQVVFIIVVDAHRQQLVDGGINDTIVGSEHSLNHVPVHGRKHVMKVIHGLVEFQLPHWRA